jgi:hypothetical protein
MKLSDYIDFIHVTDRTGKTGWTAIFAGEEANPVIPFTETKPTKQMAAQALIENAMKLRLKEFTPTDQIKQD